MKSVLVCLFSDFRTFLAKRHFQIILSSSISTIKTCLDCIMTATLRYELKSFLNLLARNKFKKNGKLKCCWCQQFFTEIYLKNAKFLESRLVIRFSHFSKTSTLYQWKIVMNVISMFIYWSKECICLIFYLIFHMSSFFSTFACQ